MKAMQFFREDVLRIVVAMRRAEAVTASRLAPVAAAMCAHPLPVVLAFALGLGTGALL